MSNHNRRMMSPPTARLRAEVKRRERLVGLFAVSYRKLQMSAAANGKQLPIGRDQYILKQIRALRLPDLKMSEATGASVRLTGQNGKYQREYEAAQRSGIRMSSTLMEYVNSRRKSDGLPMQSGKGQPAGQSGIQFRMHAGSGPEILVFGDILCGGEMNAENFVQQLRQFDGASEITIRINSDGGDPYQALAMYNALRACPSRIKTVVESYAASAASLLFMAGDIREMRPGSQLMIHEPEMGLMGRAEELRRAAGAIDKTRVSVAKIYASRSGKPLDSVLKIMKDETYFTADEAVRAGFATAAT